MKEYEKMLQELGQKSSFEQYLKALPKLREITKKSPIDRYQVYFEICQTFVTYQKNQYAKKILKEAQEYNPQIPFQETFPLIIEANYHMQSNDPHTPL